VDNSTLRSPSQVWLEFWKTNGRIQNAWFGARRGIHREWAWEAARPVSRKKYPNVSLEITYFGEF